MEVIIEQHPDMSIAASDSEVGEVYKLAGMQSYMMRVITCGSKRGTEAEEGYKFVCLNGSSMGILTQVNGNERLVQCSAKLHIN